VQQWTYLGFFIHFIHCSSDFDGPGGSMIWVVGLPNNSYNPITNTACVRARRCKFQKGALDSQPQVIKFTSCLPMVGDSLRALWLLPPLKLVAMIILLKVALNTISQSINLMLVRFL